MNMKIKKLRPDAVTPEYATPGAACFDIRAAFDGLSKQPNPSEPATIGTGLAFEVPADHVMLVFSRSGHGFNNAARLANCVGVIDSDYRGELLVKIARDSWKTAPLTIRNGDRIAQAMVIPVQQVAFEEVDELSTTERGAAGFGSTGVL